jgi:GntR family carbon starvation induced transcriptional regulator
MHDADLAPTSRTDWVIDRIRRAVLFGEVKAGERLISSTWASQLGVSATPVREAFQRLAAEGFVDYDPQRGARVAPLTIQAACEIYALRITLEPGAVVSSVSAGDDVWRRRLKHALEELEPVYETSNFGTAAAHRAFHHALRSCCDSVWLLRIVDMLADQSTRLQFSSRVARGGVAAALQEHRDLFEAAYSGNADLAGVLTAAHLQRTLSALRLEVATNES